MPDYRYSALTGSGAVEKGWMTAPSERVVEEQLRKQGTFLIQAEARRRTLVDGRIHSEDLVAFFEYLAGYLDVGIPLLTALENVTAGVRSAKLRAIIDELRVTIAQDGKSFSEALAQHPRAFPPPIVSTIQGGESHGQLALSLRQLIEYMDWQQDMTASIRQATVYPVAMFGATLLMVSGFLGFVLPRITAALRVRTVDLPPATRSLMAASLWVRHNAWVPITLAGAIAIGVILLRRSARGGMFMDTAALRIPVIGRYVLDLNMARVVTRLSLFLGTGIDLLRSLVLVENMTENRAVAGILREARDTIAGGEGIATAFGRSPLVPVVVRRSLALGEATGRLDEALDRARIYYAREIPAALGRLVAVVQPTMIVVLGVFLLFAAFAITLPILAAFNSLAVRP